MRCANWSLIVTRPHKSSLDLFRNHVNMKIVRDSTIRITVSYRHFLNWQIKSLKYLQRIVFAQPLMKILKQRNRIFVACFMNESLSITRRHMTRGWQQCIWWSILHSSDWLLFYATHTLSIQDNNNCNWLFTISPLYTQYHYHSYEWVLNTLCQWYLI